MKKFFFSAVAALMALTASAATTITVADYAATSFTTTDRHFAITAAQGEGTNAPAYNKTAGDLRIYAKGTLTIEAASAMTSIDFTISANGLTRLTSTSSADCGEMVSKLNEDGSASVKWTGNSAKVVITVGEYADLGTDGKKADGTYNAGRLAFTALTIEGGTDGQLAGAMYQIDFTASKKDWTVDDKVLPEELSYVWQQSSQYGYKASAYANGTNYATESWLISPVLDLQGHNATQATLNFTHARKYGANEHLSVKITKDGTTWETLTFSNWPTGNDWDFIEAGAVDITKYISDKTQFAFVYTSTADGAATWEIGSVTLIGDGEPFETEKVSIANTPETAYTVSEAIALIDAGEGLSDTVYVKGKVDSIGTLSDTYHNVTIRFNDGTNSMLAYNCYGLNKDSIMSQTDLDNLVKIGDDIIVIGTLTKYGSLYEFNSRCWLYSVNGNTAIDEATIENGKAEKYFRNGVLYIRRNGIEYTVMGAKAE
ncbi:MAG: choice-of-anchor J domain-containing protein [Paludibacteraceae bacterium]